MVEIKGVEEFEEKNIRSEEKVKIRSRGEKIVENWRSGVVEVEISGVEK